MSIKLLVMDVDGTLTDGEIYFSASGELFKAFNVKDGYAIAHILPLYKILPVIITGRHSDIVRLRCKELGIKHCYQGVSDKLATLKNIANMLDIDFKDIAYIGDDLNDIECIDACAVTACPFDAVSDVKASVTYICTQSGGTGAVREFVDWIIKNNYYK